MAASVVRLAAGALVGAGDSVVTGADSYAQIRFSDDALVALKPDTEFRIERFNFTGKQDGSEAAVFRLVRGGFRTLTGQIGKLNRDQYQLLTTQATIGIRGTHYQVQICAAGQCRNRGAEVGSGMYGGAYEGGVVVANGFGSGEFGADEFFYVPDGQAPLRWLGPPDFLSDKLERRARVARTAPTELRFAKVPETAPPPALPQAPFTFMATEDLDSRLLAPGQTIVVGSDRYTLELDSTSNPGLQVGIVGGALHSFHNGSLSRRSRLGSADRRRQRRVDPVRLCRRQRAQLGPLVRARIDDYAGAGESAGSQRRRRPALHLRQYGDGAADIRTGFVRGGRRHAADRFGHRRRRYAGVRRHGQRQLHHRSTRALRSHRRLQRCELYDGRHGQHRQWPLLDRRRRAAQRRVAPAAACQPLVAGNFAGFFAGPGGSGIGMDYYFNTRTGSVIEGVVGYRKCGPGGC